jgi:arsenate reductase
VAPKIEILVTPGCPHAGLAEDLVREVAGRLSPDSRIQRTVVEDAAEAVRLDFPGSPTIRIDGEDLEGPSAGPAAFACRRYDNGEGVPADWLIESRLIRALAPRHLLFLCVANSARSQMAEGIARSLAPAGVHVSSAGSEPSRVNPFALRALAEIGIDGSDQRSEGTDDVAVRVERDETPPVDAVITLCAEEVCPVWLHDAARAHWPHPDPAGVSGSEEEILASFRAVRDELVRKLETLFGIEIQKHGADMTRIELSIDGMSCDHCTARVQKALEAADGVEAVTVSLDPGGAIIEGPALDPEILIAAVEQAGYDARPAG